MTRREIIKPNGQTIKPGCFSGGARFKLNIVQPYCDTEATGISKNEKYPTCVKYLE
jgi:hypothetical protein